MKNKVNSRYDDDDMADFDPVDMYITFNYFQSASNYNVCTVRGSISVKKLNEDVGLAITNPKYFAT
jgi:hypothetical protein